MEFTLARERRAGLAERFGLGVAERFEMTWRLWDAGERKRIAVLVSRYDHCLVDLLYRWERDELEGDIVLVASNHPDLRDVVERTGLPYHHVPVDRDDKPAAEARLLALLEGAYDLVVLARYMQILSPAFSHRRPRACIRANPSWGFCCGPVASTSRSARMSTRCYRSWSWPD